MKKTLAILVASSLLFAFGCNKKEEAASDVVKAAMEVLSGDWDKSVINGLLQYVPADSAMVYGSTRNIDLDHPVMQKYLKSSEKLLRDQREMLKSTHPTDNVGMLAFYDGIIALTANYATVAPEWGLDAKGRTDSILYMTDTKIVGKLSVVDGAKLKTKVAGYLKDFKDISFTDLNVGSEKWMLLKDANDDSVALAMHFGAKELTLSVIFDMSEKMDVLNDLLKVVANPMGKEALGQVSDAMAGIGFIDNVKVFSRILNPNTELGKAWAENNSDPLSDVCASEMKSIAEAYPRIDFDVSIHDNDVRINSVFKIKSGETVSDLKSMLGKRIMIETAKSVGGLFVGLDVASSIKILSKWGNVISQNPYSCEDLGYINEAATALVSLPMLASGKNFKFVNSITGLGVSLESIEFIDDMPKIAASAYIIGSELSDAAKLLKTMLGKEVKVLKDLKVEKNVVSTIDLSALAQMPITIQTQFNDHGVIIATGEGIDIAQLAKIESKAADEDILNFKLDYKVLSLIDESLKMDYVLHMNMGIVNDGIKITSIINL